MHACQVYEGGCVFQVGKSRQTKAVIYLEPILLYGVKLTDGVK